MRKTTRVGLFCAGIALLAPRVFADAIMLEGKNFSSPSEIFLIEVEQSNDADASGSFTLELCSHCKVKGEGVFLFNPNLSRAAFSRDFFAPFAGVSSLNNTTTAAVTPPTALLSSSINAIATQSTAAPTVSVSSNSSASGSTVQLTASGGSNTNVSTSTRSTSLPPTAKGADPTFASNPEPATVFLLGTALAAGAVGRRALRGRRT
ncbi:MAG TPA: PEP-CTERM sorting domain-containing protein [Vicinamibacterales bacterium]|nr:PEP-CTERM sorting domain-containing protein [Vicinamibacterales bacterium]